MLEFQPLASSSAGNAYRVLGGGAKAPLLIDCGLSFPDLRKALSFEVCGLAGCIISHGHGDHIRAAEGLMKSGVDVWASKETWDCRKCHYPHRQKILTAGIEQRIGDWKVAPFEAVHDCPGALGFLIATPDGDRLLYLTDSVYSPFRFVGLTHIAIEVNHSVELLRKNTEAGVIDRDRYKRTIMTHMSLERALELLKANDLSKVQKIWLMHLSSANSDAAGFKSAIERATGIPTEVCAERTVCK